MKINFTLKDETKTCFRFETGDGSEKVTLYLKKNQIKADSIDPKKGITVTIEETK